MTVLDEREKAFEQAFAHDEEVLFLMLSHRNRLFGYWAANLLQYRGEVAERYVRSLVEMTGKPPHGPLTPNDAIVERVVADLEHGGLSMTHAQVRTALARFEAESEAEFGARL
jgi:hypothetical protein